MSSSLVGAPPRRRAVSDTRTSRVPAAVRWCGKVLAWCVILACLSALAAGVLVPRLFGATPYTILTGSMTPTYPPGTLVVDHKADPDKVGIGTVVTYQLRSGQPEVVTHRVVGIRYDMTGHETFVTQGDANPVPDPSPVKRAQIRGQLWYAVPYLGRVNAMLTGQARQLVTYVVAAGLAGYAGLMFAGAARDRRRRDRPAPKHR